MLLDATEVAIRHALVAPTRADSVRREWNPHRVEAVSLDPRGRGGERPPIRAANVARRALQPKPRDAFDAHTRRLAILTPSISS